MSKQTLGLSLAMVLLMARNAFACGPSGGEWLVILGLLAVMPIFGLWALFRTTRKSQWPAAICASGISFVAATMVARDPVEKIYVVGMSVVWLVIWWVLRAPHQGALYEGTLDRNETVLRVGDERFELEGETQVLGDAAWIADGAPVCVRGTVREFDAGGAYRGALQRILDVTHMSPGTVDDLLLQERRRRNLKLKLACVANAAFALLACLPT